MKSRHSKRRRTTKRAKRGRGTASNEVASPHTWLEEDGFHMLLPGVPSPELLEEFSRNFQEQIRRSPLWKKLVQQYGPQRAEQILRQCRAQLA